jgi:RHS repeat-associated protein
MQPIPRRKGRQARHLQIVEREALRQILLARYYSGGMGRFLSVDPGDDTWLGDPQSWNRYAYVRNNPVILVDPTGQYSTPRPRGPGMPKTGIQLGIWWKTRCHMCSGDGGASGTGGDSGGESEGSEPIDIGMVVHVSVEAAARGAGGAGGRGDAIEDASSVLVDFATLGLGGIFRNSLKGLVTSLVGRKAGGIVARNGTVVTGLTRHGINRAIGDGASRADVKPQAILDALKNPNTIVEGIDSKGRPFQVFHGQTARVVVNPQTGQIVSTNPLSGAGTP